MSEAQAAQLSESVRAALLSACEDALSRVRPANRLQLAKATVRGGTAVRGGAVGIELAEGSADALARRRRAALIFRWGQTEILERSVEELQVVDLSQGVANPAQGCSELLAALRRARGGST